MKKTVSILITLIMLVGGCLLTRAYAYSGKTPMFLMDYPDYRKITLDNIKSLKIIRYTEAGVNEIKVEEDKIYSIVNSLNQLGLYGETKMGCTDNTTIYLFELKDGSKEAIEIECNWVIIKGKRYNLMVYPKAPLKKK